MKKSELRKIVRESIKRLMNEQGTITSHNTIVFEVCDTGGTPGMSVGQIISTSHWNPNEGWECNGVACTPNDIDQPFTYTTNNGNVLKFYLKELLLPIYSPATPNNLNITSTTCPNTPPPPSSNHVCQDGNCLDCSNPQYSNYCNNSSLPQFPNLNACLNSNCGGNDLCKGCQSQNWPGYNNWVNTFMNQPHFNSSNPNQPCNMICNKIQTWQNKCSIVTGPQQKNKLGCKIALAQQLSHPSIHNCNC